MTTTLIATATLVIGLVAGVLYGSKITADIREKLDAVHQKVSALEQKLAAKL
ncbi:MAG: hypothetical protein JSR67_03600 [Proteobacteria bacterium]|nr:hypothetical protein [Pseudomonadota bacterium]